VPDPDLIGLHDCLKQRTGIGIWAMLADEINDTAVYARLRYQRRR